MQSTFKNIRIKLLKWIFEKSIHLYAKNFKRNKTIWNITKQDLVNYPNDTLGKELYNFLIQNNLEVIPKSEHHDCYHVLTGYQANIKDEIALQYLCFANGKRTINLFLIIIVGTLLLPDYFTYYLKSYKIGKKANLFHQLDFQKLLSVNLNEIQTVIFSKNQLFKLLKTRQYV